jgi:ribosomal protein L40E
MNSTLAQIVLAAVILGSAGLITQAFARAMYIVCPKCRTLNARRRQACRHCHSELRAER